jgi:hypothetical protein
MGFPETVGAAVAVAVAMVGFGVGVRVAVGAGGDVAGFSPASAVGVVRPLGALMLLLPEVAVGNP